jgi:hypothetical protein
VRHTTHAWPKRTSEAWIDHSSQDKAGDEKEGLSGQGELERHGLVVDRNEHQNEERDDAGGA